MPTKTKDTFLASGNRFGIDSDGHVRDGGGFALCGLAHPLPITGITGREKLTCVDCAFWLCPTDEGECVGGKLTLAPLIFKPSPVYKCAHCDGSLPSPLMYWWNGLDPEIPGGWYCLPCVKGWTDQSLDDYGPRLSDYLDQGEVNE